MPRGRLSERDLRSSGDKMSAPAVALPTPSLDRALSILVVEDDAAHARVVAEALGRSGHRVDVATSGRAGLERLESTLPDLVVTDLRLDDLDGSRVVARCRELRGERATPQCLVVTGFGTVEGAVAAMQAGALNFLTKPVDLGVLRQTVFAAAERIALERTNRE